MIVCPKDQREFQITNANDLGTNFGILEMLENAVETEGTAGGDGGSGGGNEAIVMCKDHNRVKELCVCVCVLCV